MYYYLVRCQGLTLFALFLLYCWWRKNYFSWTTFYHLVTEVQPFSIWLPLIPCEGKYRWGISLIFVWCRTSLYPLYAISFWVLWLKKTGFSWDLFLYNSCGGLGCRILKYAAQDIWKIKRKSQELTVVGPEIPNQFHFVFPSFSVLFWLLYYV